MAPTTGTLLRLVTAMDAHLSVVVPAADETSEIDTKTAVGWLDR